MAITQDEVSYDFFLPEDILEDLSEDKRQALIDEVGEYLLDSILDYVGEAKTPVKGGKFKATLNQAYADREKAGDNAANLDLNGDMLNALEIKADYESGKITIGIFDEGQTPKAYNHNVGDTLPKRQFIPDEGQSFKPEILKGVRRIIQEYIDDG